MKTALLLLFLLPGAASAAGEAPSRPIHPAFPLLDEKGGRAIETGRPVSAMRTCGVCHDVEFIETHSAHADAGLRGSGPAGSARSGRPWDTGEGFFGRWNPITYRLLSPEGDKTIDLSLPDWIRFFGRRHVGGGPALRSRDGSLLAETKSSGPTDPGASWLNPITNRREAWDWGASGAVEMNCFLCHLPNPDNDARAEALEKGAFRWASTATLARTGIVARGETTWTWNRDAFDRDGNVNPDRLRVQDPTNENCGQCHGLVHGDPDLPVLLKGCRPEFWNTLTTGQIISPQRISDSGLNVKDKEKLRRTWDVHSERVVECANCHYSLNNPIYRSGLDASSPAHLRFDARRMSMGEYLRRPDHRLAQARPDSGGRAREATGSPEGCESCHRPEATHTWLPYWKRHLDVLACNACHVPRLYAPARQVVDWTVLTPERKPRTACRGTRSPLDPEVLVEGYEPVLLMRQDGGRRAKLYPYNIVSSWFWVAGDPARPVSEVLLAEAYFDGDDYRESVLDALDADGDRRLVDDELVLDTPEKVHAIRERLVASGIKDPRISAEAEPYVISHGVATAEWSTRECRSCHSRDSRLSRSFGIADAAPGGVLPAFTRGNEVIQTGDMLRDPDGRIRLLPLARERHLHVLGHHTSRAANVFGLSCLGGVLAGIVIHGGLRLRASRRSPIHETGPLADAERVYMYSAYERLWHWLQALAVLVLLVTGIAIEFPGGIPLLGFGLAVRLHNIIGFIVVTNAALAAFYHLASGEIRQYVPDTGNFFSQAIVQARYYLRGIFHGEPHPFEKRRGRKLNPLQQATYLAILNVLLPLQAVTGVLIWGVQKWPEVDAVLGGLTVLAPVHAAGAWAFAAFLLMHVYLTTIGPRPTGHIRAMVTGWEQVERDATNKEEWS